LAQSSQSHGAHSDSSASSPTTGSNGSSSPAVGAPSAAPGTAAGTPGSASAADLAPDHCDLCGSREVRFLFRRAGHSTIQLARPYSYHACANCGVHFLRTSGLPDDLYHEEKQATVAQGSRRYVHWDRDIARALWREVPGGRLLDFGSGYGDMLIAAKEQGYEPQGLDVSPVFAKEAHDRSGCPVFVGPLGEAHFPDAHFSVVNAHCAFEYVPNLSEVVGEVARILAPTGVFRICTHTSDSFPARLHSSEWWNYTPTRLFVLSHRTIEYLARRHGLRVTSVVYGGEQSLASYLAEDVEPNLYQELRDRLLYRVKRLHWRALSMTSCCAFYLRK